MNNNITHIYFFIGTEAELIKVFPIMLKLKGQSINFKVIASGQNDIANSRVLQEGNGGRIDILLSDSSKIKKSVIGLFSWFIITYLSAKKKLKNEQDLRGSIMLVHGDTVSTVMGALLGNKFKMTVAHIEAGLRSFDIFNPFPEEIDRIITSKYARLHFAPGEKECSNLKKVKGEVYNTLHNTIIDSMRYYKEIGADSTLIEMVKPLKYFVFVMHRQENIANRDLIKSIITKVADIAKKIKCVMVLHEPTVVKLKEFNLLDGIKTNGDIITTPRVDYFEFMKLLESSEFVITDGGSNQEELHYMGKPCLIIRKKTERGQGLGSNALMYNENLDAISDFMENYKKYRITATDRTISPSEIIVNRLLGNIEIT